MTSALVGHPAPDFHLQCTDSGSKSVRVANLTDYHGSWLILVFYPRDFSFVCPTELASFSGRMEDFSRRRCQLLGVSVDSIESHAQWLKASPDDGGLGALDPEAKY